MKHKVKRCAGLLMSVLMLAGVTGCSKDNDDSSIKEDEQGYVASLNTAWREDGRYEGEVSFSDDFKGKLTDFNTKSFELLLSDRNSASNYATLSQFSVTRKDDKTISYSFETPFNETDYIYTFYSKGSVTSDKKKVAAVIYIEKPTIEISHTATGSYFGTEGIDLNLTLGEYGKFVPELKNTMFLFSDEFQPKVSIERKSDKEVSLRLTEIPTDYYANYFEMMVDEAAIDHPYKMDVTISEKFYQPYVLVDSDSVTLDEENKTLTVTNIYLPDGYEGKENGLSMGGYYGTIKQQSYNAATKSYSATFELSDSFATLSESLQWLTVSATLVIDGVEMSHEFNPYCGDTIIEARPRTDEGSKTVSIDLIPHNGSFVDGIKLSDLTLSGMESLTNLSLVANQDGTLTLSGKYANEADLGFVAFVTIPNRFVNAMNVKEDFKCCAYLSRETDGKEIDWAKLGKKIGTSAATSLGSEIGSSLAKLALPYIYDFFGIDSTDPQIAQINKQLSEVGLVLNDINTSLQNLRTTVENAADRSILNTFQIMKDNLTSESLTIMSSQPTEQLLEQLKGYVINNTNPDLNSFYNSKFAAHVKSAYYAKDDYDPESEFAYKLENGVIFDDFLIEIRQGASKASVLHSLEIYFEASYHTSIDVNYLYDCLMNCIKHVIPEELTVKPSDTASVDLTGFKAVVDKVGGSKFLADVKAFGGQILGTSCGTAPDIIELYFRTVDATYNFASQTFEAKKGFVASVQAAYLASAAIAIEYADEDDDYNAAVLRKQVVAVAKALDKYQKALDNQKPILDKGKDIILFSGQTVSKQMGLFDVSKDVDRPVVTNGDVWQAANVEPDTVVEMMTRASKRGLSLAQEMTNAGFSGLVGNDSTYAYLCNNYDYDEISPSNFKLGMQALILSVEFDCVWKGNVVTQKGKENGDKHLGQELYRFNHCAYFLGKMGIKDTKFKRANNYVVFFNK